MKIKYPKDDVDILKEFVEEAKEMLQTIEDEILIMGNTQGTPDEDVINPIFRAIHTIKGTSGFLALDHVKNLSHQAEFLLDDIRNGKQPVTPKAITLLLDTVDMLKTMLEQVEEFCESLPDEIDEKYLFEAENLPYETIVEDIKILLETRVPPLEPGKKETESVITIEAAKIGRPAILRFSLSSPKQMKKIRTGLEEFSQNKNMLSSIMQAAGYLKQSAEEIDFKSLLIKIDELNKILGSLSKIKPGQLKPCIETLEKLYSNMDDLVKQLVKTLDIPAPVKKKAKKRADDIDVSSIRVPSDRLDKFMDKVGELVVREHFFHSLSEELNIKYHLPEMGKWVKDMGNEISGIAHELQDDIMDIRKVPVKVVFNKFNRMVFDLSKKTKKPLKLVIEGGETELDKTVIERIGDPLVHMIRNSADHGIEDKQDERLAKGKPAEGIILLRARQQGQHVLIEVKDDGKGLPQKIIVEKALEKGLITKESLDSMSDDDVYQLIMMPGFSTVEKVTQVSGRGVGMDVVKSNIEQIKGSVLIRSEEDVGTTVTLSIPLTLTVTVTHGLEVRAGDEHFILPLKYVRECIKVEQQKIRQFQEGRMISHRDRILKVVSLEEILHIKHSAGPDCHMASLVILNTGEDTIALEVTAFYKQVAIMEKPLDGVVDQTPGISGACVQSDGKIIMILNPLELAH